MTGPNNEWTRYTYGNTFRYDEGKLKKVESGSTTAQNMRVTEYTYNLDISAAPGTYPYPARYGQGSQINYDSFQAEYHRPLLSTTILQQGEAFTRQATLFDAWAWPTREVRSSTLGDTRTEDTAYHDNTTKWVLGQVATVTHIPNVLTIASFVVGGEAPALGRQAMTFAAPRAFASRIWGPSGPIFGRKGMGGRSLITGDALRVGWGWKGSRTTGKHVFRVSGEWVEALGVKSGHIDIIVLP